MKNLAKVEDRIRSLLNEAFEERVKEAEERLPHCCVYNHRQPLDTRRRVNGQPNLGFNRITVGNPEIGIPVQQSIGLCMYGAENPEEWPGNICEEPIDAQRCPLFVAKRTREAIKKEFEVQIRDLEWVRVNMPDVHALLWVLDNDGVEEASKQEFSPSVVACSQAPQALPMHWWHRLVLWLLSKVSRKGLKGP